MKGDEQFFHSYLGDGVYVEFENGQYILRTGQHTDQTQQEFEHQKKTFSELGISIDDQRQNKIYLGPEALHALVSFVVKIESNIDFKKLMDPYNYEHNNT